MREVSLEQIYFGEKGSCLVGGEGARMVFQRRGLTDGSFLLESELVSFHSDNWVLCYISCSTDRVPECCCLHPTQLLRQS